MRVNTLTMKRMGAVESDKVKSARKFHKACERASETHEQTLHQIAWAGTKQCTWQA